MGKLIIACGDWLGSNYHKLQFPLFQYSPSQHLGSETIAAVEIKSNSEGLANTLVHDANKLLKYVTRPDTGDRNLARNSAPFCRAHPLQAAAAIGSHNDSVADRVALMLHAMTVQQIDTNLFIPYSS